MLYLLTVRQDDAGSPASRQWKKDVADGGNLQLWQGSLVNKLAISPASTPSLLLTMHLVPSSSRCSTPRQRTKPSTWTSSTPSSIKARCTSNSHTHFQICGRRTIRETGARISVCSRVPYPRCRSGRTRRRCGLLYLCRRRLRNVKNCEHCRNNDQ